VREWVPDTAVIRMAAYDIAFPERKHKSDSNTILFAFGPTREARDAVIANPSLQYAALKVPGRDTFAIVGPGPAASKFHMKDSEIAVVVDQAEALIKEAKGRYLQLAAIVQGEHALDMIEGKDPRVILRDAVDAAMSRLVRTIPSLPRRTVDIAQYLTLRCDAGEFTISVYPDSSGFGWVNMGMKADAKKPWEIGMAPYMIARRMPEIIQWCVRASAYMAALRRISV